MYDVFHVENIGTSDTYYIRFLDKMYSSANFFFFSFSIYLQVKRVIEHLVRKSYYPLCIFGHFYAKSVMDLQDSGAHLGKAGR